MGARSPDDQRAIFDMYIVDRRGHRIEGGVEERIGRFFKEHASERRNLQACNLHRVHAQSELGSARLNAAPKLQRRAGKRETCQARRTGHDDPRGRLKRHGRVLQPATVKKPENQVSREDLRLYLRAAEGGDPCCVAIHVHISQLGVKAVNDGAAGALHTDADRMNANKAGGKPLDAFDLDIVAHSRAKR